MSANHFSFKQFTIQQELCAMKVGTDGVLLGAWADVKSSSLQADRSTSILDVGTGTGLIALMAAQRYPEAHIIAIDVNPDAVLQAQENVGASPFANRVIVRQADFRKGFEGHFDAILCNPPYFENALRCPDASRSTARHSDTLSFDDLALNASSLLRPLGTLSVIIPSERRMDMISACATHGLILIRETHVRTLPTKPPKRVLLEFISGLIGQQERMDYPEFPEISTLTIESTPGVPTPEFKAMLEEFYLKF